MPVGVPRLKPRREVREAVDAELSRPTRVEVDVARLRRARGAGPPSRAPRASSSGRCGCRTRKKPGQKTRRVRVDHALLERGRRDDRLVGRARRDTGSEIARFWSGFHSSVVSAFQIARVDAAREVVRVEARAARPSRARRRCARRARPPRPSRAARPGSIVARTRPRPPAGGRGRSSSTTLPPGTRLDLVEHVHLAARDVDDHVAAAGAPAQRCGSRIASMPALPDHVALPVVGERARLELLAADLAERSRARARRARPSR